MRNLQVKHRDRKLQTRNQSSFMKKK